MGSGFAFVSVRARARAHNVHVDIGPRVFGVIQIKHGLPVYDPDRHGRDVIGDRQRGRYLAVAVQFAKREHQRHERARDGSRSRSAVCLNHVAVEVYRTFAEAVPP